MPSPAEIFRPLKGPGILQSLRELVRPRELECLQVEVTSCCAGRCVYCPHTTEGSLWKARHMSPEVFAALWPMMLKASRIHLQGWGEPFLHPYFLDFVGLARRAECSVSTTTCGLYMDEALAARIVSSGIDILAFSLTGTDEASSRARAGVPFARVEESVRTLQKVRKAKNGVHLEIHLAYLMLASQIEDVRRLPELMERWDVHAAVVSTMDYVPSPALAEEAFAPHEREKIEKARIVLEEAGKRVRASGRDFFASLPAEHPAPSCRERVHRTMYVDAEGQVSPCVYLNVPTQGSQPRRTVFGEVSRENPLEIWNKPEYAAFRSSVQTAEPPQACRSCAKRFEAPCALRRTEPQPR
ncbi:radical SAM/SPASM domain-containing protein [uncultured Mailhella sp.]|uniref:radical SAM/SPASM domain-containing protein n=1 Tax=uncultured Mailhella sp. TaxID=1981031 RepID=UPI00261C4B14|nr:radical SAM/SPASM domain-containing protein [uncultured Mailhella sp.]